MITRLLACLLLSQGISHGVAAQILTNNGAHIVVQSGATLYVGGSLTNSQVSTLTNAGTVKLTGNFLSTGTLSSSGLVLFTGTANQTLTAPGSSLGQVELNNTGAVGQNTLLIPENITITQLLKLTQGMVSTPATKAIMLVQGAEVQGEGPGRYVQGNLSVVRTSVSGLVDFGNGARLDATGSPLGTVTVKRMAGLTTAGTSYGINPQGGPTKSIDRIWTITSTQAPSKAIPLTFSWIPDNDNGLVGFNPAQVWQQVPATGSWFTTSAATDASSRSITTTATSFSSWTVSNAANPLPVQLTNFLATRQNNDAWLRWTTATEFKNDYFEVESSADGRQFRSIGRMTGLGTSAQGKTYELKDPNIARYGSATVYYRLRQVDQDGTETYSAVRTLSVTAVPQLQVQAYPNPFSETLAVQIEAPEAGPATLALRDALGRTVWQQRLVLARGATSYSISAAASMPQGVYLLTITQATQQQRITITRQ
jgi:hypothetical protein